MRTTITWLACCVCVLICPVCVLAQAPGASQIWDVRLATDCRDAPAVGITIQARVAIIPNINGTANFGVMRVGGADGSLLITVTDPNGLAPGATTQGALTRGTTGEVTGAGVLRVDTGGAALTGLFAPFRGFLQPVATGGVNADPLNGVFRVLDTGQNTITAIVSTRSGIYDGQPLGRATVGPTGALVGEYANIYRFLYTPVARTGTDWNPNITVSVRDLSARYIYGVNGTTLSAAPAVSIPDRTLTFQVPTSPVVFAQPVGGAACPGRPMTLSARVVGLGPLSYQWFRDGAAVAGATGTSLTLATVSAETVGRYRLYASSPCGDATSDEAVVVLSDATAPTIARQPSSVTACASTPIRLEAQIDGTATGLQWLKGDAPVAGATTAVLNLGGAAADAGSYRLRADWACGSVTSDAATVTINTTRPTITQQPEALTRALGETAVFSAGASAGPGETVILQWYRGATALADDGRITGSQTGSLLIAHLQRSDSGVYQLHAVDSCGSIASEAVRLNLTGPATGTPPGRGQTQHESGSALNRDTTPPPPPPPPPPPACPGDFNHDGALDPDDLADLITCFYSSPACPAADVNGDGAIDGDDLADAITSFFGGC